MRKIEFLRLRLGVYRVWWKSGGSSVLALGNSPDGTRWIAPSNWVSGSCLLDSDLNWKYIKKIRKVTFLAR